MQSGADVGFHDMIETAMLCHAMPESVVTWEEAGAICCLAGRRLQRRFLATGMHWQYAPGGAA